MAELQDALEGRSHTALARWPGSGAANPPRRRIARFAGLPRFPVIVTGFALGAALFALVDNAESGLEQPVASITDGCTTLALDRSNGRTEAGPCAELFGPQTPRPRRPRCSWRRPLTDNRLGSQQLRTGAAAPRKLATLSAPFGAPHDPKNNSGPERGPILKTISARFSR